MSEKWEARPYKVQCLNSQKSKDKELTRESHECLKCLIKYKYN